MYTIMFLMLFQGEYNSTMFGSDRNVMGARWVEIDTVEVLTTERECVRKITQIMLAYNPDGVLNAKCVQEK